MDNKKVLNRTYNNLRFRGDRDIQKWVKAFNELNDDKKFDIIRHMEKEQARFIRYSMEHMHRPINLYKIGSFYYKNNRVRFYELKKENPSKSIDEIVDMLKEEVKNKNNQ